MDLPTTYEEHNIERVAVNQIVEAPPAVRYEGDTMIIPILREELVVEKRIVLVEELRVTKRQVHSHDSQRVMLRKEEVIVERTPSKLDHPSSTQEITE